MHDDLTSPFTLTIAGRSLCLPVAHFTGREALNEPYCFDIELAAPGTPGALDDWLQQPAFLRLGDGSGIHGVITRAHPCGRHCNLSLAPHLATLAQRTCRRVLHDVSVPGMLLQLLQEHRLPADSYRFELPHGQYPKRAFCIQYDESDLYFLQRLCEEEGIHYHFEHQQERHVLVFADDSEAFVPLSTPLSCPPREPAAPALAWLAQAQPAQPRPNPCGPNTPSATPAGAANQPHDPPARHWERPSPTEAHRQQTSRHALERLRSQPPCLVGQSSEAHLRSGALMQVEDHPVSRFNDQWLLTEVHHQGRQPGFTTPASRQPWWVATERLGGTALMPGHQWASEPYGNQFKAIPWATAYRPALRHPKPLVNGYQRGYVPGARGQLAEQDAQGRIPVHLAWGETPERVPQHCLWLPLVRQEAAGYGPLPTAGCEVLVRFVNGDPDYPVVFQLAGAPFEAQRKGLYLNGQQLAEKTRQIYLKAGQSLRVQGSEHLTLTVNGQHIRLDPDGVALAATPRPTLPPAAEPDALWDGEICLFAAPPLAARRLANTSWYIVRMPRADLQEPAGLGRDAIVLQGQSLASGALDLNPQQKRLLAREFARTPRQLSLLYPGHCVALAEYFQQHWSQPQRQALHRCAKAQAAPAALAEAPLLLQWLMGEP